MPFKVAARLVLQLGAELISSDGIAFYELIKNAFDAGSFVVLIDVFQRLPFEKYHALRQQVTDHLAQSAGTDQEVEALKTCRDAAISAAIPETPRVPEVLQALERADSWTALGDALDSSNYILITDFGSGMTAKVLDDVYLTLGTRSRLVEREERERHKQQARQSPGAGGAEVDNPILGEKGIGRLSAMRLGDRLRVETSVTGESALNVLDIDWRVFSHDSDDLIADIPIDPVTGPRKDDPGSKGTRLQISALTSDWSIEKLSELATREFGKLFDPFASASRYDIRATFNGRKVVVPELAETTALLFEHAHAVVNATYSMDNAGPKLIGRTSYRLRNREKIISKNTAELASMTKVSAETLVSLGPFEMTLYWFNRQLLGREFDSIGDKKQVLGLQTEWSGGLKLYRDGFRVNPYGNKDDDWLDLDRKAFASSGYKVNRTQIVGRVKITTEYNPALIDQTNREGVRDCPEKQALVAILKSILETEFRGFLNQVDNELRAQDPLTFGELGSRVLTQEKQIRRGLAQLVAKHPEIRKETQIVQLVEQSAKRIRDLMQTAQELADRVEEGHSQLLHLAGLGLMVEILAHELTRTTQNTLRIVTSSAKSTSDRKLGSTFRTLESQLKTLERRLRVLDPLSVSGRQRKEDFDLIAWIEDILTSHDAQFKRHDISWQLLVLPRRPDSGLIIKAVKGMIVQIMENLLSNSVYWLKVQKRLDKTFQPAISVEIDTRTVELRVTDNGPGIEPIHSEDVFQPFITSKPPGEGKGLGLYISREIAKYHGADLSLLPVATAHVDRLNTFVLRLQGTSK